MAKAEAIGFPLVVRPSYVLGGRAMEIVYDLEDLRRYMTEAVSVSNDSPVLLDPSLMMLLKLISMWFVTVLMWLLVVLCNTLNKRVFTRVTLHVHYLPIA